MSPRPLASLLMFATGAAHLLQYALQGFAEADAGLGLFGALYLVTGALLRTKGKLGPLLGIVFPALGGLGGAAALASSFDPVMLGYVAVDVAVVVLCIRLLWAGGEARDST